jgi:oligopeptidase B
MRGQGRFWGVLIVLGLWAVWGCDRPTLPPPALPPAVAPEPARPDGAALDRPLQGPRDRSALGESAELQPPRAERIESVSIVHGERRVDPYAWLRNRDDSKVKKYLEAENAYAQAALADTADLQEQLCDEMESRLQSADQSVPVKYGAYYYYTRTGEEDQYDIHCRKRGSLDAKEEVILDENKLAADHEFFDLGVAAVSPDHATLAYSIDTAGQERYVLGFIDLASGKKYDESIANTTPEVAWALDCRTIFYSTLDESFRSHRVYRHTLGNDPAGDVLVFEEPDAAFAVYPNQTTSHKYLLLEIGSNTTTEIHYLDSNDATGVFRVIGPRSPGVEYSVDHHGELFYILTNDQAKNFRLVTAPVATPSKEHWTEVIPHREDVTLEGVQCFANHLVVVERAAGASSLRVRDLRNGQEHKVEFPEPSFLFEGGPNPEFETQSFRFTYTSFVTPLSTFDYDMETRQRVLLKEEPVLGGYDRGKYQAERVFATAQDGTKIPISLVYKIDALRRDGSNPALLEAYGAYGLAEDPYFDSARLTLLNRGFVCGIAHVRGGGEFGRSWYEAGKLLQKKNTFSDFVACAEFLIAEKYTSPEKLAIWGASAGGLLVGAVLNERPDLFAAAVADVPFVDVLNTMLDPSLPLTVTEYEEWGNPQEKRFYDYIRSYCPYQNVRPQAYPHLLIFAGWNDSRVNYWEPAKWAARLRAARTDKNLLLLKTNFAAGHEGASGRFEYIEDAAFEYAFLIKCLKVSTP